MVVALATDEGVWRAVLANKKIQEYRVVNAEGISSLQNFIKSRLCSSRFESRCMYVCLPAINLPLAHVLTNFAMQGILKVKILTPSQLKAVWR